MKSNPAPAALAALVLSGAALGQARLFEFHGTDFGGGLGDRFGAALAAAGDTNGDGSADLAVGAPHNDTFAPDAGTVIVYSGFRGEPQLISRGFFAGGHFGYAVAGIGDVDGNGAADLAVGAPGEPLGGIRPGSVYVLRGSSGTHLLVLHGESDLDRFGHAVAGAGDVDGDGTPDVLVGAPGSDLAGIDAGSAYVFSGRDGSLLWQFQGDAPGGDFGSAVAGVGDVDGDGRPDVAVGAWRSNSGGSAWAGRVRVFSGRTGAVLHTFDGGFAAEGLGFSLAGPGDLDFDGRPDIAVGVPGLSVVAQNQGGVRVFSGRTGAMILEWVGPMGRESAGWSLAALGDFDGDLTPDLVVGARYGPQFSNSATARVISGRTGAVLLELRSDEVGDGFGQAVSGLGDVNGDGRFELAVGAPTAGYPDGGPGSAAIFLSGCPEPERYCFAAANSTGIGARIGHQGGPSVVVNRFDLTARDAPPGNLGIFFYGSARAQVPFGDGFLCAAGSMARLGPPVVIDASGFARRQVDFTRPPAGMGPQAILPGSTWHFQLWYRDPGGPLGSGSNLTDALAATFCP